MFSQAMNYILENWGSLVGALGLVFTIGGVAISFAAFRRAGKARDAAKAAETASRETRATITSVITTIDLQRAINLAQRLKELHREGQWAVSLALYPTLRTTLVDIISRHPALTPELNRQLQAAILQVSETENNVATALSEDSEPAGLQSVNGILNDIQGKLEILSSYINQSWGQSFGGPNE